jgi:ribonucleoside-triphosphate reductase
MLKMPVECYSRVVGYFRPVNQWNKGKQAEFADRKTYNVNIKSESVTDGTEKM